MTAEQSGAPTDGSAPPRETLEQDAVNVLKTCYDPEIPVDIYELGLIYEIKVEPENRVLVKMTLTSPACPVAGSLPGEVEAKVRSVPGVSEARVELDVPAAGERDRRRVPPDRRR